MGTTTTPQYLSMLDSCPQDLSTWTRERLDEMLALHRTGVYRVERHRQNARAIEAELARREDDGAAEIFFCDGSCLA